MKRILSVLVLVLAITFQTNAQERKRTHQKGQNLTAEQIATLGSKKMTLGLDLTASQEKQVFGLLKNQAQNRIDMKAKHKEMRENGEQLSEDQKFDLRVAQLDRQIAFKAEMKKILNEEQYGKWSKKMAQAKQKMKKKGAQKNRRNNGNRAR